MREGSLKGEHSPVTVNEGVGGPLKNHWCLAVYGVGGPHKSTAPSTSDHRVPAASAATTGKQENWILLGR